MGSKQSSKDFNNEEEYLYRMIHSSWIDQGNVMSVAFKPSRKDNNKLSTFRSSKINPKEAYENHIKNVNNNYQGVLANTIKEVKSDQSLPLIDDEEEHGKGHVSVDFESLSNGQKNKVSRKLRDYAFERSWQYKP